MDKVKVKSTKSPTHYSKPPNKQSSSTSTSVPMLKYDCKFCGRKHLATKESCPAYGQECRKCGQENHFSKFCPKKDSKVQTLNRKEDDYDDSELTQDEARLGAVQNTGRSTIRAKMLVNDCEVNFEIDSGAEVNMIQQKYALKRQGKPATLSLTMWNHSLEEPLRETTKTDFIVFSNKFNNLLGVAAVQHMNLITVNKQKFTVGQVAVSELGKKNLGEVHLYTDDDVNPRALPCRIVPIALHDPVKQELEWVS